MANTVTFRGQAAFEGVEGIFDLIVYPLAQSGKTTHQWNEEKVQDVHGFDCSWLARNGNMMSDWGFKLMGPATAGGQANAVSGAVFLAPMATVTLSGFGPAFLNAQWQTQPGQEITMEFDKVATMSLKLLGYDNSTQNTLANTTPS